MSTNVQDFFDKSKNLKLKTRVEQLLKNCPIDFVSVFAKARLLTINDASKKPSYYKQRNYMAENMYGNVIGILYDNFPDYMEKDTHERPYVVLEKDIRLYIKKLTKKYLPNNIKTKHVDCLNAQELFDQDEHIHVVYAGFVLEQNDWALDFKEICLSYLNKAFRNVAAWIVDLSADDYRKNKSIVTYLDTDASKEEKLVSVPMKQNRKSNQQ